MNPEMGVCESPDIKSIAHGEANIENPKEKVEAKKIRYSICPKI